MRDNKLDYNNLIAFSGDNASVNYGIHHPVYKSFKDENQNIIKTNSNCHILHNTIKNALTPLPFNVENLGLKIYSHFFYFCKKNE